MPRKRRSPRQRKSWSLGEMLLSDVLTLNDGWSPPRPDSLTELRTLEDCFDAYRDTLEAWQVIRRFHGPGPDETLASHIPGLRAWIWWRVEWGMEPPRNQPRWLRRHGLLSADEETELGEWDADLRAAGYGGGVVEYFG